MQLEKLIRDYGRTTVTCQGNSTCWLEFAKTGWGGGGGRVRDTMLTSETNTTEQQYRDLRVKYYIPIGMKAMVSPLCSPHLERWRREP